MVHTNMELLVPLLFQSPQSPCEVIHNYLHEMTQIHLRLFINTRWTSQKSKRTLIKGYTNRPAHTFSRKGYINCQRCELVQYPFYSLLGNKKSAFDWFFQVCLHSCLRDIVDWMNFLDEWTITEPTMSFGITLVLPQRPLLACIEDRVDQNPKYLIASTNRKT